MLSASCMKVALIADPETTSTKREDGGRGTEAGIAVTGEESRLSPISFKAFTRK